MRRFHQSNIVFIHIPKTAGMAVTNCFGLEHLSTDHLVNSDKDKTYLNDDFIRFCVVRNPFTRFISGYKYQCYRQHKNTDKIRTRKIIRDNKLDSDINEFIDFLIDSEFDIRRELWFRPQIRFIRATKPHILLRQENLESEIQIIRRLIPEYYVGLSRVNSSSDRPEQSSITSRLSPKSIEFIKSTYINDFRFLGYSESTPTSLS